MTTAVPTSALKVHPVSWHETHRDATDLAHRLADLGPWRGLIAVSRGGLVPAAVVARVLHIRVVDTICVASYDGRAKGAVVVVKDAPAAAGDGSGWLVVDDVADTGATAGAVRQRLPAAHFAALYAKPAGRPHVDTRLRDYAQEVWIDFPWDRDPAIV
jgi:xanthine phosphoribosyltransferase